MKSLDVSGSPSLDSALQSDDPGPILLTRDGRPVALVTPLDEDELEEIALENDPEFLASIARARAQVASGDFVEHDALMRELGLE